MCHSVHVHRSFNEETTKLIKLSSRDQLSLNHKCVPGNLRGDNGRLVPPSASRIFTKCRRLTTVWGSMTYYRDSFTFTSFIKQQQDHIQENSAALLTTARTHARTHARTGTGCEFHHLRARPSKLGHYHWKHIFIREQFWQARRALSETVAAWNSRILLDCARTFYSLPQGHIYRGQAVE
jgi:hypothetical protein